MATPTKAAKSKTAATPKKAAQPKTAAKPKKAAPPTKAQACKRKTAKLTKAAADINIAKKGEDINEANANERMLDDYWMKWQLAENMATFNLMRRLQGCC